MISYDGKPELARRRTLSVLAVATAIGSVGLAAGGTAGALLGVQLTGTEAAAGLPLGLLVVGQAATALVVSRKTTHVGRGRSLAFGYVLGVVGAAMVAFSAVVGSFALLLTGSLLLGAGNTAVFMTRYAAAEVGGENTRGRAMGAVFFATAIGAVASPGLLGPSGELARTVGLPPLAGLYVVAIACFMVAALLLSVASTPAIPFLGGGASLLDAPQEVRPTRAEVVSGLGAPPARIAVAVLAATNVVMVAIMAVAPVHMVSYGHHLSLVGIVVGVHVAGMFALSPISGWAADRFGPTVVARAGFVLILVSGAAGFLLDTGSAFWMTAMLLTLGVGWNLGVVGGSTMLTNSVTPSLRRTSRGSARCRWGSRPARAPL